MRLSQRLSRYIPPALCLAITVAVVIAFWPLRRAGFLNYDDDIYVTDNGFTPQGITWDGLVWAATNAEFNWHPVTWLSHMLDSHLFGLNPAAHHAMSVAIHLLNAGLLFRLLLRLSGARWPSVLVAALFALHPLHVEPVAWISARKDLLSTTFWLLALLAYARYVRQATMGRMALVVLWMALSLMSKGMAVALPVTLWLLDYWPLRRSPSRDADGRSRPLCIVREKLPLILLAAGGMVIQIVAQRLSGGLRSLEEVPLAVRLTNAIVSYALYVAKTLWPVNLAVPYPLPTELPSPWLIAAGGLWLAGASAAVAFWGPRRRYLIVGWLWYLVTLLPVIGLVPIGYQAMADRYLYLPSIGLFVIVAWSLAELVARRPLLRVPLAIVAAVAVGACAALTRLQAAYWVDSITLFRHTLAVTTNNIAAHDNLGTALLKAGRPEEAAAEFHAALRINPQNAGAHNNLGSMLLERGDFEGAEPHLREAVRLRPGMVAARINLGTVLLQRGDAPGAREQFAAAVQRRPWKATAQLGLGQALERQGLLAEARAAYERAARLDPALAAAHIALAEGFERDGRSAEALAAYERAIAASPGSADGHLRFARALERAGRRDDALAHYREAARLAPGDAEARNSLGAALRAAGARAEAHEQFLAAVHIDPDLAPARNNLGVMLTEDGQFADAETEFQAALRVRPDYLQARLNLGLAQLQSGKAAAARGQFAMVVDRQPDHIGALLGLAKASELAGDPEAARAAYERALAVNGDVLEAQLRLAQLAEASGNRGEAARRYAEALRLHPDDAETRAALARVSEPRR